MLEALLKRGDNVVGIDTLLHENALKNIREVVNNKHTGTFSLHTVDIRDREKIEKILCSTKFDAVIHLAGLAGVRKSIENPGSYIDVNVNGTLSLLDACVKSATRRFVFASSSSVYGECHGQLFEDMMLFPQSPYAASKVSAEALCNAYNNCFNMSALSLRFFTAYGPRNRPDMMAYKVLDSIFQHKLLTVYNDGNMLRDWTYVADIVEGIVAAVDSQETCALNLGAGSPTLLSNFIKEIEDYASTKFPAKERRCNISLKIQSAPKADVFKTYACQNKAIENLGIKMNTSLSKGVQHLVDWYVTEEMGVLGSLEHV